MADIVYVLGMNTTTRLPDHLISRMANAAALTASRCPTCNAGIGKHCQPRPASGAHADRPFSAEVYRETLATLRAMH